MVPRQFHHLKLSEPSGDTGREDLDRKLKFSSERESADLNSSGSNVEKYLNSGHFTSELELASAWACFPQSCPGC